MSSPTQSINEREREEEEEVRSAVSPVEDRSSATLDKLIDLMDALTARQAEAEARQRETEERQTDVLTRILDRLEDREVVVREQTGLRTANSSTQLQPVEKGLELVCPTRRHHSVVISTSVNEERRQAATLSCLPIARKEVLAGAREMQYRQSGTVGFEPERGRSNASAPHGACPFRI